MPRPSSDEATYTEPGALPDRASTTSSSTAGRRSSTAPRPASAPADCCGGPDRPGHVTASRDRAPSRRLPGGPIAYTLRRSPRSRGLRVVIHPDRGMVVTVPPPPGAAGRTPTARIRDVPRPSASRGSGATWPGRRAIAPTLAARGGLRDGATIRYRGDLHRLRVVPARPGVRRSTVERIGGADEDELDRPSGPVRPALDGGGPGGVAQAAGPGRDRARRRPARRRPSASARPRSSVRDQRTRWGSASRQGRLAFSWRLILAPPEALETVVIHELAHLRVFGHGPTFWDGRRLAPARSQGRGAAGCATIRRSCTARSTTPCRDRRRAGWWWR